MVPGFMLRWLGKGEDLLGHLGWRSPLRTTALQALDDGIRGDPTAWAQAGGTPCQSLELSPAQLPSPRQERLFARAFLLLPMAIGVLSLFWCLSGLITLLDPGRAMAVLTDRAVPGWIAPPFVTGGALADIALGLASLWRPWVIRAALGMVGLAAVAGLGGLVAGALCRRWPVLAADGLDADPHARPGASGRGGGRPAAPPSTTGCFAGGSPSAFLPSRRCWGLSG